MVSCLGVAAWGGCGWDLYIVILLCGLLYSVVNGYPEGWCWDSVCLVEFSALDA